MTKQIIENSYSSEIKTFPNLPVTGFMRLPQVLELIPVSQSTWWAGVASGRFPKPYKPTPRTSAWKCEDIRNLIEAIGHDDHE